MKISTLLSVIALIAFSTTATVAVEPNEILEDPNLEQRARVISKDLRCVVCQNETIDESNATLAQDMRRLVRQRVQAGDSNQEVLDYMVDRYGDFVLLRPQFKSQTYLLWFGPIALLLVGAFIVVRHVKASSRIWASDLTEAEAAEVNKLLHEPDRGVDT